MDYVETKIRNEAGLRSRASIGSGDAGAHLWNSAESNKLESSPESASPSQQQPPIEGWPRDELEELRSQVAERDAQLEQAFRDPCPSDVRERGGGYPVRNAGGTRCLRRPRAMGVTCTSTLGAPPSTHMVGA